MQEILKHFNSNDVLDTETYLATLHNLQFSLLVEGAGSSGQMDSIGRPRWTQSLKFQPSSFGQLGLKKFYPKQKRHCKNNSVTENL